MKKIYLLFALFFLGPAFADPSTPTNKDPQWLIESRANIKSGKYEQAIQILQASNQTTSAEWNNLMGYSQRQKQVPDLIAAQNFYEAALLIDPNHKGTLEYYGMLKLKNNDLPGAELLLARLKKGCFLSVRNTLI